MMKIAINFFESSFSEEIYSEKREILTYIENSINQKINGTYYGESIRLFIIGLICVKPSIDHLFKARRPKFTANGTVVLGGIQRNIEKTLEIEIKMDYERVLAAEGDVLREIVATEVLNTLHTLKLPKKVTDFDKDRFVADVESVFRSEHLIA